MAAVNSVYYFLDQNTQNPLPQGLGYTIYLYGMPQVPGNVIASGTLGSGGSAVIALLASTWYTAVFTGTGAPAGPYNFLTGDGTQVVGPFAAISNQLNSANGYIGYQNTDTTLTLEQWGEVAVTTDANGNGSTSVTFPLQFPTAVLRIFTGVDDGASFSGYGTGSRAVSRTANGFTMVVFGGPPNSTVNAEYKAIGH